MVLIFWLKSCNCFILNLQRMKKFFGDVFLRIANCKQQSLALFARSEQMAGQASYVFDITGSVDTGGMAGLVSLRRDSLS